MFRKIFFHGVTAGFLASLAGFIYSRIYYFATEIDFSRVAGLTAVSGYCFLFCMLAAVLNFTCLRLSKNRGEIIFNFILSIVSFAMVMIPISISLPLNVKSPELFPGLGVPIIFFPAIAWYTVNPIFNSYSAERSV
jgi:hypothetical protein